MKKIVIFALLICLVSFVFAACGEGTPTDSQNGATGEQNTTAGNQKGEYTLSVPVEYDPEKSMVIGFRDLDSFVRFKEMTTKSDSEIRDYFEQEHFEEYTGKEDMAYVIGIVGNIPVLDLGPDYQVVAISLWNKSGYVDVIYEKDDKQLTVCSYIDTSAPISVDGESFTDITVNGEAITLYWNFSSNTTYVFSGIARNDSYLMEIRLPRMTADAIRESLPANLEVVTIDQLILKNW